MFGDSYADTGNIRKSLADSWKMPYGVSFPGKPSGRFSDGRIATDFLGYLSLYLILFVTTNVEWIVHACGRPLVSTHEQTRNYRLKPYCFVRLIRLTT